MTNNATKSANRGKKRKKPAPAASAADDEGGGGGDESGSSAVIMQSDAVRVPGLSHDLQQQITKFDSSEFDVSELEDSYWGAEDIHRLRGPTQRYGL